MKKGLLTREQAVAEVGEDAVRAVERENCEQTNRVGYNGASQGDDLTEWTASVACQDRQGDDVSLTAYYYTTNEEDEQIADAGADGSAITWEIHGFEIV